MKKIIFFDGDGTLWYPKLTKKSQPPHWIYSHPKTKLNPNKYLIRIPGTLKTIRHLKKKGLILIVLSAHPRPSKESAKELEERLKLFGLANISMSFILLFQFRKSKENTFSIFVLKEKFLLNQQR